MIFRSRRYPFGVDPHQGLARKLYFPMLRAADIGMKLEAQRMRARVGHCAGKRIRSDLSSSQFVNCETKTARRSGSLPSIAQLEMRPGGPQAERCAAPIDPSA